MFERCPDSEARFGVGKGTVRRRLGGERFGAWYSESTVVRYGFPGSGAAPLIPMNMFRRREKMKKVQNEPEFIREETPERMEGPRLIVGLDFGTTYSGFAFAHIHEKEKIYTFYDYPRAGYEKPYCKTLTGMYYKRQSEPGGKWHLKSWGHPARAEYEKDFTAVIKQRQRGATDDPFQPSLGNLFTRFKLHLGKERGPASPIPLPPGLTVHTLITDYLRAMGGLVLKTLQDHYGTQLDMKGIQWCITVPSIWDNSAKAIMKDCMKSAGLVGGEHGSPHQLIIVLEPEAASFHCHKVMNEQVLSVGDKLLVADIGGGTSDLIVQEVISVGERGYRVKELTISSGGYCGGTYVDARFTNYLHAKIGPALQECLQEFPGVLPTLLKTWEHTKSMFGDPSFAERTSDLNLPVKLVTTWERYDLRNNIPARGDGYETLEITYEEMQSIFDPVVNENLELIAAQLQQVGFVKILVIVGGFAGSRYLTDRIKERFGRIVPQIIIPPNPGSAICQGAVALALNPDTVDSRICKKTYGIHAMDSFQEGVDPPEYMEIYDGVPKCKNRFEVYVSKGDSVKENEPITRSFKPVRYGQKAITLELYSSDMTNPRYIVGDSACMEGSITIDISKDMKLQTERLLNVSLFFGKSCLDFIAEPVNFSAGKNHRLRLPIKESGFF